MTKNTPSMAMVKPWQPGDSVYIESERLIIRSLAPLDINEDYVSWWNDTDIQNGLNKPVRNWSRLDALRHIQTFDNKEKFHLGLFSLEAGLIGFCSIFLNKKNSVAIFNLVIGHNDFRDESIAEENALSLMPFIFGPLAAEKIQTEVIGSNLTYQTEILRMGLQREGIQRSAQANHQEGREDLHLFGMTKQRWQLIEQNGLPDKRDVIKLLRVEDSLTCDEVKTPAVPETTLNAGCPFVAEKNGYLQECSEHITQWMTQARQAEKAQQAETAELYYSKVLTLDSNALQARAGLALMTMHQLRLPEARLHFREALRILLTEAITLAPVRARTDFNTPEHEALLWQTLVLLAKHDIHAVAHAGTLLGLIREGALLPGDKDLDLALPHHEIKPALDCLLKHGWQINPLPVPLINPISCCHTETGLVLDLCGVRIDEQSEKVISGFWTKDPRDDWQRVTEFSQPFSITQQERAEGVVWSLVNPEDWLTDLYGDWRIPDPEFDTVIFAANMKGFSLLTQCYAYNRLMWLWKKGYLSKALRIAVYMAGKETDDALMHTVINRLKVLINNEKG